MFRFCVIVLGTGSLDRRIGSKTAHVCDMLGMFTVNVQGNFKKNKKTHLKLKILTSEFH